MMSVDESVKIFCKNIRDLRKRQNLSQKEMANILGIGVKSLSMIENDVLPPCLNCEILFRIQNYFGIKPPNMFDQLFDE